jgi:hypothetical protein
MEAPSNPGRFTVVERALSAAGLTVAIRRALPGFAQYLVADASDSTLLDLSWDATEYVRFSRLSSGRFWELTNLSPTRFLPCSGAPKLATSLLKAMAAPAIKLHC